MKMTGKLSILIFLCKTNCGSIQYNSEGEGCPTNHTLSKLPVAKCQISRTFEQTQWDIVSHQRDQNSSVSSAESPFE